MSAILSVAAPHLYKQLLSFYKRVVVSHGKSLAVICTKRIMKTKPTTQPSTIEQTCEKKASKLEESNVTSNSIYDTNSTFM
mgnify:CR=1 FL=1